MTRETGHCDSTCQLHEGAMKLVDKHEVVLFGCDDDGGLIANVKLIKDTVDTIKKCVYGVMGFMCLAVVGALVKLVIGT